MNKMLGVFLLVVFTFGGGPTFSIYPARLTHSLEAAAPPLSLRFCSLQGQGGRFDFLAFLPSIAMSLRSRG
jgi:hypothetical protein